MCDYIKVNTKKYRNFTRNGSPSQLITACSFLQTPSPSSVPVKFLATLPIETVLNRQQCGEFFHMLWRVKDLSLLESEKEHF